MKTFLVMIFILFLTGISYAQKEMEDCLNYFNSGDYQRAIESCQRAVELYPGNADAYLCLGTAYYQTGQIDLAIDSLKKAEFYTTREDYLTVIYNDLGNIYRNKGDFDKALFYGMKGLNLARKLGNRKLEAFSLFTIATIFGNKGEFDRALEYYKEALRLTTDERDKADICHIIAFTYKIKEDYPNSIKYFKKAINIYERYGDYHQSGIIMLNLGDTYRIIKDFKNAYYYLYEGIKRVGKAGDKFWIGHGGKFVGLYYRDVGDKKSARKALNMAYEIFESIDDEDSASEVLDYLLELDKR